MKNRTFPKLNIEHIHEHFLSEENLLTLSKIISSKLCIDNINSDIIDKVRKQVNIKYYKSPSIDDLNNRVINYISERFLPQKNVIYFNSKSKLPQQPMPNIKYEKTPTFTSILPPQETRTVPFSIPQSQLPTQQTKTQPSAQLSQPKPSADIIQKQQYNLSTFFTSKNIVYRPESGTFYNSDNNIFYNPSIGIMYDPKQNKYIDTSTGNVVSKDANIDIKAFFGVGDSKKLTTPLQSSRFDFYDSTTGLTTKLNNRDEKMLRNINDNSQFGTIITRQGISNQYNNSNYMKNGNIIVNEYIVSIDSRHRDVRIFPSSSNYTIRLQKKNNETFGYINNMPDIIRGVTKIELVHATIPNIFTISPGSVTDTYLLLAIDEITGRFFNSAPLGQNIFGKMKFDLDLPVFVDYLNIDPIEAFREYHPEPLSTTLPSITVRILNFNGNQVNFGQDTFSLRYWQASGVTTVITTWLPNQLTTGDLVYFRNTNNPILDNMYDGIKVLVISPTIFTVNIDSSTTAAALPPNIGGPPVNPNDPANSSGIAFPLIPPNDPQNPYEYFGFILKPELQNTFTFRIITEDKTQTHISAAELADSVSSY